MPAILFGSISTLADTSELQRTAYNEAFTSHGLDWEWDRHTYRSLLVKSGGRNRIAEQAVSRSEPVDADAVHETKSKLFQEKLPTADLVARPGVVDVIRQARDAGLKVGLVTTTSPANVQALLAALGPDVSPESFDLIVDSSHVEQPKPAPAAYRYALEQLEESAADCVAIEDNVGGVQAATAAEVTTVAFPNANTAGQDFSPARETDELDLALLRQAIGDGA